MSAKFGHGVDDVKEWILSKLPKGPAYYPKVCILCFQYISENFLRKISRRCDCSFGMIGFHLFNQKPI